MHCRPRRLRASTGGSARRPTKIREEARKGRERARSDAVRDALAALRPGDVIFVPRAKRRGLAVVLVGPRGASDRARAGPQVLPPVGPRLRRAARLPDEGAVASDRERSERPIPPGPRRPPGRARRAPAETLSGRCRREGRARGRALRASGRGAPVPRLPRPRRRTSGGRRARASSSSRSTASTAGSARGPRRSPASSSACSACSRTWATSTASRSSPKGHLLARIYGEGDVLVAEAIAEGLLDGLAPAEAAALVSTVVYESRERVPRQGEMPTTEVAERYRRLSSHRGPGCAAPRTSTTWSSAASSTTASRRRCSTGRTGKPLEDVLRETTMAPGDFVRNCKQLLDLLRQIADVAPSDGRDRSRRGGREPRRRRLHRRVRPSGRGAGAIGCPPCRARTDR